MKSFLFLFCLLFLSMSNRAVCGASPAPSSCKKQQSAQLKIVSWNVETFFDARRDGTEYAEFLRASAGWGRDAYVSRLEKLCKAVSRLDADVFVMEEIENKGILYDISNHLAVYSWRRKKLYRYGCFASVPGSALGCAVLSRYPLSDLTVHALDIRTGCTRQPSMRPLMEVSVSTGGRKLIVAINHWKSKSGDAEKSEIWRIWQESVLASRINLYTASGQPTVAVLACGDFNRDIEDFCQNADFSVSRQTTDRGERQDIVLRYSNPGFTGVIPVCSSWRIAGNVLQSGSFYFRNRAERIDSFFTAGNADILSFSVESTGPWADETGKPRAYCLHSGSGYSDHLPISCIVRF